MREMIIKRGLRLTSLIELKMKVEMIKREMRVEEEIVPQLHLLKQELATIILIVLSLPLLFLIKQQLNNLCKLKQIC